MEEYTILYTPFQHVLGILIPLLCIALSGHIIWRSTDSFEIAADYLGRKMSKGVKGATINAVASSMPEFLTTMFFLFYIKDEGEFADSFSGGLGVVAGSAIFNILIIPLAILLLITLRSATNKFKVDRKILRRDGLFLLFANLVFIWVILNRDLTIWHGVLLVGIYLLYLFLLRKGMGLNDDEPIKYEAVKFSANKTQFRDFLFLDIGKIFFKGRSLNKSSSWIILILSTLFMSLGTWLLVEGTHMLGEASYPLPIFNYELPGLGIPIIVVSVILASAATSIPDTMISIRDAHKGNHDDSISNAIGSNIFDISFAIGFPLLLFTLIHGSFSLSEKIWLWSMEILLSMFAINLIVIILFQINRIHNRIKAIVLAAIYIGFVVVVITGSSIDGFAKIIAFLAKLVS